MRHFSFMIFWLLLPSCAEQELSGPAGSQEQFAYFQNTQNFIPYLLVNDKLPKVDFCLEVRDSENWQKGERFAKIANAAMDNWLAAVPEKYRNRVEFGGARVSETHNGCPSGHLRETGTQTIFVYVDFENFSEFVSSLGMESKPQESWGAVKRDNKLILNALGPAPEHVIAKFIGSLFGFGQVSRADKSGYSVEELSPLPESVMGTAGSLTDYDKLAVKALFQLIESGKVQKGRCPEGFEAFTPSERNHSLTYCKPSAATKEPLQTSDTSPSCYHFIGGALAYKNKAQTPLNTYVGRNSEADNVYVEVLQFSGEWAQVVPKKNSTTVDSLPEMDEMSCEAKKCAVWLQADASDFKETDSSNCQ